MGERVLSALTKMDLDNDRDKREGTKLVKATKCPGVHFFITTTMLCLKSAVNGFESQKKLTEWKCDFL